MMYEYLFVEVPMQWEGGKPTSAYQQVIRDHAAQGWRFVQLVVRVPAAVPTAYDLIFERPMREQSGQNQPDHQ